MGALFRYVQNTQKPTKKLMKWRFSTSVICILLTVIAGLLVLIEIADSIQTSRKPKYNGIRTAKINKFINDNDWNMRWSLHR